VEPVAPRPAHAPADDALKNDLAEDVDVMAVRIPDDLDAATAPEVGELLRRVVQPGSRIVLDMSSVAFMDCAGLSELLRAYRRAAEGGGWIRLACVQDGPLRVLDLTGTADLLLSRRIPGQRDGGA
jgi:anti-sigma B factor antagonist